MVGRYKGIGRGGTCYEIVVRGELSERFAQEFGGMDLKTESGRTVLVGEIIDQAHLHGLLDHLQDFALKLLSVEPTPKEEKDKLRPSRAEDTSSRK